MSALLLAHHWITVINWMADISGEDSPRAHQVVASCNSLLSANAFSASRSWEGWRFLRRNYDTCLELVSLWMSVSNNSDSRE